MQAGFDRQQEQIARQQERIAALEARLRDRGSTEP